MTTLLLHMFLYWKFCTIISNASVIIHRHTCLPTFLMMLVIVMLLTNTYSTYYVPGTVLTTLYTLSPNPHSSLRSVLVVSPWYSWGKLSHRLSEIPTGPVKRLLFHSHIEPVLTMKSSSVGVCYTCEWYVNTEGNSSDQVTCDLVLGLSHSYCESWENSVSQLYNEEYELGRLHSCSL